MRTLKATLIFLAITVFSISAQVPRTMNYQGKLTDDSGIAVTGPVSITFRIYDVVSGGTALWSEAHASVTVTNGLFDVILGESSPMDMDFDDQYWMELVVGGETLTPREKLAAVPYAHRAAYSDTALVIGSGAVQTTARLTGDGTTSDPLDIAQQEASSGQVLKWNGSSWAPNSDNNTTYSAGNGISLSSTTFSVAGGSGLQQEASGLRLLYINAGSSNQGALWYNGVSRVAGNLYGGTTNPTSTNRLNYDGYFYATRLYSNGAQVLTGNQNITLSGDVTGSGTTSIASTVQGLQGKSVASTAPSSGQVLKWNGSSWAPSADATGSNYYVTGVSFNTSSGDLTLTRSGLSSLTTNLDGRYLTSISETDPTWSGTANTTSTIGRTGNVGIGTTSPDMTLDVRSTIGVATADESQFLNLSAVPTGQRIRFSNASHLEFGAGAGYGGLGSYSEIMRIDGVNSRVGIGTTTPSAQLHTTGTVRLGGLSGTGTRMVTADVNGNLSTATIPGGVSGSGVDNYLARWDGTSALQNSAVYVTDAGKVGIGTTTPASDLSVGGAGSSSYAVYSTGATYAFYGNGSSYGLYVTGGYCGVQATTSTGAYGVYGSTAGSGGTGGWFTNTSTTTSNQYGVQGFATGASTSGNGYGVRGEANGSGKTNNYGVYGTASGGSTDYGVYGTGDYGVYGVNSTRYGYLGGSSYGVYGYNGGNYGYLGGSAYGGYVNNSDGKHYAYIGTSGEGLDAWNSDAFESSDHRAIRGEISGSGNGTNYGYGYSRQGVQGRNDGGSYSFGTFGVANSSFNRTGGAMGVLGAATSPTAWGSLGYRNSGGSTYGGYFNGGTGSGTGRRRPDADDTRNYIGEKREDMGFGAYSSFMGGWVRGEIYGLHLRGPRYALYADGDSYTNGVQGFVKQSSRGAKSVMYSSISNEVTINTCGMTELVDGTCRVVFDRDFSNLVSDSRPIIVTATPLGASNGVYVTDITKDGFTIVENNEGRSNLSINWMATAIQDGYEDGAEIPEEILANDYDANMRGVMFDERNTEDSAKPIHWDYSRLSFEPQPKSAEAIAFEAAFEKYLTDPASMTDQDWEDCNMSKEDWLKKVEHDKLFEESRKQINTNSADKVIGKIHQAE